MVFLKALLLYKNSFICCLRLTIDFVSTILRDKSIETLSILCDDL